MLQNLGINTKEYAEFKSFFKKKYIYIYREF